MNPYRVAPALAGAVWVLLVLLGADGLFTIDELIYFGAAAAVAEHLSIFIDNGYDRFGSEALRLWFLVAGPNGLAPQYPSGYPALAAPAFALLGARGMMLVNVAAAVGTLMLCHRIAMRLFGDAVLARAAVLILALASFLGDYAVAIWPHALSALVVASATLLGAEAALGGAEGNRDRRFALSAGLVIGLGMLVRLDATLVVPPLLIWVLVVSPSPLRLVPAAALGLTPGVALAAALNLAKFDVLSPFSYGSTGGSDDPSGYLPLMALFLLAASACLWLRSAAVTRRAVVPGMILALAVLIAAVPAFREAMMGYLRGLYVLLIDLRLSDDPRPGILRGEDGSVSFWGLSKKALGQSLPWLGLLMLLFARPRSLGERRAVALLSLTVVLWMLPFARTAWHGGFGSNLRYFLPVLPHLAILAAVAWRRLEEKIDGGPQFAVVLRYAASATAVAFAAAWVALGTDAMVLLQHALPPFFLAALALAATATALPGRTGRSAAAPTRFIFAVALCYASLLGMADMGINQIVRGEHRQLREAAAREIPATSLVYSSRPEFFPSQLGREGRLLARPPVGGPLFDVGLVHAALNEGFRVFLHGDEFAAILAGYAPELHLVPFIPAEGANTLWEVRLDIDAADRARGAPTGGAPGRS